MINEQKVLKQRFLISGKQSRLKNIKALAYSKRLKRIFVLDSQEKAILSFSVFIGGNIAPKRKLYDESFDLADSLVIDDANEEIYLISEIHKWIKVYKSRADIDNRDPAHDTNVLRSLDLTLLGITSIKEFSFTDTLNIIDEENLEFKIEKTNLNWK